MARIRTIKPEFWEDEKIARLSMPCRLFFIGTWSIADDAGVFRSNCALLKSKIFPYEDIRLSEIQKHLDALVEARMILPISHNGESFYVIRTFRSHQKFDPRYPNCLIDNEILTALMNPQQPPAESPACPHRAPATGGGRGEGKGKGDIPPLPPKGGIVFDFSFVDESLKQPFNEWLEYKASRKEKYKSQKSLQKCYNQLLELADNNPKAAQAIVDRSMANGWQGMFELPASRQTQPLENPNEPLPSGENYCEIPR